MRALRCALIAQFIAAAAPSMAHAFDWSPTDARILGDPSFLPTAGEVSGSFGYTYSANLFDAKASRAAYPSEYDRSENAFLPALQFGITDDVTVFGNLGFGNVRNRQDYAFNELVFVPGTAGPVPASGFGVYNPAPLAPNPHFPPLPRFRTVTVRGVNQYRAIGADNPEFGLEWRVIDQRSAPVNVDLFGLYSPDIVQGREATAQQTGSLATGGQAGSAEMAVSREMQSFTVRVFGTFTYEGRRNRVVPGLSEDFRSAPHPSYAVGLQTQTRLLPWLALDVGVTAQQAVRYDRFVITPENSTPETIKPSGVVSPYAGLQVPLLNRHVVGEVLYQHDFIDNESIDLPLDATTRYYKQERNLYTARVLFAFGGAPLPLPAPRGAPSPPLAGPGPQPARTYLVFFDWDRADLTVRARQIVAQAAQASTRATTRIEVDGYTDLSGTAIYNQRLSVRRAQSVQAELVRDGVGRDEISIQGYGEANPLVPTQAGVREPQNRRVEIILRQG